MIEPIWPSAATIPQRFLPAGSSWRKSWAPVSLVQKPNAFSRSERERLGKMNGVEAS